MSEILRLSGNERFARLELISWWDQQRLAAAKVVVVGAGALGNEILKNLALLGVGRVFLIDFDQVESSNLSRSVLFRPEDCGKRKVDVAARRAVEIYPDLRVRPFHGNVVYDVGLGLFRWADVVLAGLDNREARVAINRAAARAGTVWIDGAIERLQGVARVFDPACGPCYECTMSEVDWKMLEARRSCALLSRSELEQGKVPTTPTTASVIAGIQCQEAVKYLHGLETLVGKGFVFDGQTHQSYVVSYSQKPDCPSHEPYEPVEVLDWSVEETTAGELLQKVRSDLGPDAVVEFNNDLLRSLECPKCGRETLVLTSLARVTEQEARCPVCGENRVPHLFHTLSGDEDFLDRTLSQLGVPPWDVVVGRRGLEQRFYELAGDRGRVLGCLEDEPSECRDGASPAAQTPSR